MNKNVAEVQTLLDADIKNGLMNNDIIQRQKKYGFNRLKIKKRKNFFIRFIEQFKDPMLILLLIAAIISFVMAGISSHDDNIDKIEKIIHWVEPSIIIAIVLINSIFGAIQELRAEKAMDSLSKMSTPIAKVLRNGVFDQISSHDIFPGDIVILEAGDTIPADGILIESSSLRVVESALTGESIPVEKNDEFEFDESTPMADRLNCVYSGTNVINGRAKFIVTKTGMNTEIGKIASMLNNTKDEWSPLEKRMAKVGRILSVFALICLIFVFLLYILYVNNVANIKDTWVEGFKISISIAIAVVPEGLLAILTIVLALGMKRMIKFNALIKKTSSVETLGSASVICSDKTGTLTQNKMTIVQIFSKNDFYNDFDKNKDIKSLIEYGMLCNDTKLDDGNLVGDPTETSIVKLGNDIGIDFSKLNSTFKRVDELPFDSDRKLMTTIHKINDGYIIITKGAPDNLFTICKNDISNFKKANDKMGKKALRVLAIAIKKIKKLPKEINFKNIEKELELIGLLGIIDPPRDEVKQSIQTCLNAGIRPIMITGDHINTATAIANELGIIQGNQKTISGIELSDMSDEEFRNKIEDYSVYARVSPEDKIRVVKAWQSKGQIVAMTGDGVNDAPALKAADIGCAMGITGTEVSKDAADMILMDDNFNTIVEAVKEGRGVLDNIKRIMITLFTTNLCELLTLVIGMLAFAASPFSAIQILWVNLVTESLPGIALGMKKPEKYIMKFEPKDSKNLLNGKMLFRIISQGIIFAILSLIAFYIGASSMCNYNFNEMYNNFKNPNSIIVKDMQLRGSTLAFIVLAISQSFNAFNTFSKNNIITYKWEEIKYVFMAFLISFLSIMFVLFVPTINDIFNSNVYKFDNEWYLPLIFFGVAFIPTIIFEISKCINNSIWFSNVINKHKILKILI